jgi:ribosomal protein L11 methyltransferase
LNAESGESGSAREAHERWLSVRIRPGSHREAVVAALFTLGAQGVQELDDQLVTLLADTNQADAVTCAVLAASPDAQIETKPTAPIDWRERWKSAIHAQQLGPITIVPPWLANEHEEATTVVIEPGMAFGTGEHPTTRGVVRLLPKVMRRGDRVADLGAGSAILSIAAVKLGASHAFAIELDHDAIGNAEGNVARNGVSDRVTVLEGDAAVLLRLVSPIDLVLANIISSVICELLPAIASSLSARGRAIFSGMLREEQGEMLAAFDAQHWRVEHEDLEDIWWTVALARR